MAKYTNCKFQTDEKYTIDCLKDGEPIAVSVDPSNADYAAIIEQGAPVADYTPSAITWADIRSERDSLLAATDWCAVSDRAMSADETNYRQALRDVPQNFASPADVVWPTKP